MPNDYPLAVRELSLKMTGSNNENLLNIATWCPIAFFYKVFSLLRILRDYMQEGHEYDDELISYLSPYVTAHVKRFEK